MLDSTASLQLVAHLADLAHAGATVVVCEHRAQYLDAIPGLSTTCLDGTAPRPSPPSRDGPGSPRALPEPAPFTLTVSGLNVSLDGRPVLRNLDLVASGGQVLAIVGRNGVGKTTLLRAMAGLQPYDGNITVGGQRPDLAMVFENADLQLFNATVRDEVLYQIDDPDLDRYAWLMAALGLSRYEETPPLLLSEGEKKRLALALTLMRGPRHGVLLDEPSLGQDAAHKQLLVRLAHALADTGYLVILTTHDLSLAAQADRLLILGHEGFVADGPPDAIFSDHAAWDRVGLRVPRWVTDR
jgi:energy-coupling factor transport system ATP-binding protein